MYISLIYALHIDMRGKTMLDMTEQVHLVW